MGKFLSFSVMRIWIIRILAIIVAGYLMYMIAPILGLKGSVYIHGTGACIGCVSVLIYGVITKYFENKGWKLRSTNWMIRMSDRFRKMFPYTFPFDLSAMLIYIWLIYPQLESLSSVSMVVGLILNYFISYFVGTFIGFIANGINDWPTYK